MKELSKSIARRQRDPNFATRYFVGRGIDIGGFPDPLNLYAELFPRIDDVRIWDLQDGDAQYMEGVEDDSFDFIVSSHCLEHLHDPREGLSNWLRIVKPGGHLVVTVPEEDLYEQGTWPSNKNLDHKHTFTIHKNSSWCKDSINLMFLLKDLGAAADIRKIEVLDSGFRYSLPEFDQTLSPVSESAIEFVIRKRTSSEIVNGTNRTVSTEQPPALLRKYLNQYRDDLTTLKAANKEREVFKNEAEL